MQKPSSTMMYQHQLLSRHSLTPPSPLTTRRSVLGTTLKGQTSQPYRQPPSSIARCLFASPLDECTLARSVTPSTSAVSVAANADERIEQGGALFALHPIPNLDSKSLIRFTRYTGLSAQQTRLHHWLLMYLRHLLTTHSTNYRAWCRFIDSLMTTRLSLSTLIKVAGSMIGAVKRATTYGITDTITIPRILYDTIATWKIQLLKVKKLDLPGISPQHVRHLIATLSPTPALYLALLYRSAHRSTSIRDLQRQDVLLNCHPSLASPTTATVTLRFRSGKTQRVTEIYCITVHVHQHEVLHLQTLLNDHSSPYLFKSRMQTASTVSEALRSIGYCVRSVRRGALRQLASLGTPLRDLLLLSRHTTEKALYQYLRGGASVLQEADTQASMSALLL
mmetsp:Transcript_78270/g.91416  ORF Transcript_78270/g.91416 Transcript_78270/m.91416 type:complete len:393 (-) Transcript_78270:1769-2947(-)